MPECSGFDGIPFLGEDFRPGKSTFTFDAWRTLSNVAMDYAWGRQDAWERDQSNRVLKFFESEGPNWTRAYQLDGQRIGKGKSQGLMAMMAVAGLAAEPDLATALRATALGSAVSNGELTLLQRAFDPAGTARS